jgi:hypothetical protein
MYNEAYIKFEKYYLEKKRTGYEIYISSDLKTLLSNFWVTSLELYKDNELLRNQSKVEQLGSIADETTNYMEELFGLQGGIKLSLKKKVLRLFRRQR